MWVGNPGNANDPDDGDASTYGMNYVGAVDYVYNIGKYEVTTGQYTEFLNAVARVDTYGLHDTEMWSDGYGCKIQRSGSSGSYSYTIATNREKRPVNYVSWADAARFSNWLHNGQPTGAQDNSTTEDGAYALNGATSKVELMAVTREGDARWFIPSEDEWYKAAYHKNDGVTGNYFDYPTGSDSVPSNDRINPDPGSNANFWQDNGFTIGSPYYTTKVGEFENSESPYGTFDQGGNLFEWNESIRAGYSGLVLRGGTWGSQSGDLRADYRGHHSPTSHRSILTFRMARIPEPGSITLLVCGALGLLAYGWRRKR